MSVENDSGECCLPLLVGGVLAADFDAAATTSCCRVAICGRPISRYLDNGTTLEITRVCTNGERNACSMLYGACVRAAKALGYKKVITYTLLSENGASLKAANFINDGVAGGEIWTGKRKRNNGVPAEKKNSVGFSNLNVVGGQNVNVNAAYQENGRQGLSSG